MKQRFGIVLALVCMVFGCDKNDNFIIFSIQNDIDLGGQVSEEIASDPAQFPILDRVEYANAYAYMDAMRDQILNSGEVAYKNEFVWKMHIIDADVLNAFATPGGYIYVYTGLIKYLDNADDLAGVLGHELAHADLRHTSRNLQKQYGVSILLSIVLGQNATEMEKIAGQIAGTIAGLSFSRKFETESDAQSVVYLAQTDYACNGAASFFEKLEAEGQLTPPEFLSTHPSPDTRILDINTKATDLGCDTGLISETGTTYQDFQNMF